jgi:hypothetical protein
MSGSPYTRAADPDSRKTTPRAAFTRTRFYDHPMRERNLTRGADIRRPENFSPRTLRPHPRSLIGPELRVQDPVFGHARAVQAQRGGRLHVRLRPRLRAVRDRHA